MKESKNPGKELPQARAGHSPFEGEMRAAVDLKRFLFILLEKAWIVVLSLIIGVSLCAWYLKRAPRIYSATATLQVEQVERKVVTKIESVVSEDLRSQEQLNTIAQRLRAHSLLERVILTNKLPADPRFSGGATNAPSLQDHILRLDGMIDVRLRRNTRLIDIVVSHTNPELGAQVANWLVEEFVGQDYQMYLHTTTGASEVLKEEELRLRKKLEESEKELQRYRQKTGVMTFDPAQDLVLPQLRDLNAKVTQAKSDRIQKEKVNDQVLKAGTNIETLLTLGIVANDPQVTDLRSTVIKQEIEFVAIQKRYKEKYPKYIRAASQLQETRAKFTNAVYSIVANVRTGYEAALAQETELAKAFHEAEKNALTMGEQAINYNALAREVESDRAMFESVLKRLKETTITAGIQPDKVRLIQTARIPERPSSPNVSRIASLGLLGSLLAGIALALLVHSLDSSIRTVDECEQALGLPVFGTIPFLKAVKRDKSGIVFSNDSKSAGAEAFRTLRSSLSLLGRDENHRVFLFTSAFPQEGKTFCCVNYAASLAQQGLRTLLIDADLRRPAIAATLKRVPREHAGLTDRLLGRAALPETAQATELANLFYVDAGARVPNPAELLAQSDFEGMIREALSLYDRVVIDSAPIHAVSDTLTILKHAHTVSLIVRSNKTPRRAVQRSVELIERAGSRVAGVVLNWLPFMRGRSYYYGSYYYGHYYHDYTDYYSERGERKSGKPSSKNDASA